VRSTSLSAGVRSAKPKPNPPETRSVSGGLSGAIALAPQEGARELGVVCARDEDDEHAAVLGRDVAQLEVLDVDAGRAERLRDAREDAGLVRDADPDAVQLARPVR